MLKLKSKKSIGKNKGFSLIEMLVVISLVGILMTISLIAFSQVKKNARDNKRKADLEQIRSSLEIYRTDCKTYPQTLSFGGNLTGAETNCLGEEYLALVPNDPLSPTYAYSYLRSSANNYFLCAYLETGSASSTACQSGCVAACNYEVDNP